MDPGPGHYRTVRVQATLSGDALQSGVLVPTDSERPSDVDAYTIPALVNLFTRSALERVSDDDIREAVALDENYLKPGMGEDKVYQAVVHALEDSVRERTRLSDGKNVSDAEVDQLLETLREISRGKTSDVFLTFSVEFKDVKRQISGQELLMMSLSDQDREAYVRDQKIPDDDIDDSMVNLIIDTVDQQRKEEGEEEALVEAINAAEVAQIDMMDVVVSRHENQVYTTGHPDLPPITLFGRCLDHWQARRELGEPDLGSLIGPITMGTPMDNIRIAAHLGAAPNNSFDARRQMAKGYEYQMKRMSAILYYVPLSYLPFSERLALVAMLMSTPTYASPGEPQDFNCVLRTALDLDKQAWIDRVHRLTAGAAQRPLSVLQCIEPCLKYAKNLALSIGDNVRSSDSIVDTLIEHLDASAQLVANVALYNERLLCTDQPQVVYGDDTANLSWLPATVRIDEATHAGNLTKGRFDDYCEHGVEFSMRLKELGEILSDMTTDALKVLETADKFNQFVEESMIGTSITMVGNHEMAILDLVPNFQHSYSTVLSLYDSGKGTHSASVSDAYKGIEPFLTRKQSSDLAFARDGNYTLLQMFDIIKDYDKGLAEAERTMAGAKSRLAVSVESQLLAVGVLIEMGVSALLNLTPHSGIGARLLQPLKWLEFDARQWPDGRGFLSQHVSRMVSADRGNIVNDLRNASVGLGRSRRIPIDSDSPVARVIQASAPQDLSVMFALYVAWPVLFDPGNLGDAKLIEEIVERVVLRGNNLEAHQDQELSFLDAISTIVKREPVHQDDYRPGRIVPSGASGRISVSATSPTFSEIAQAYRQNRRRSGDVVEVFLEHIDGSLAGHSPDFMSNQESLLKNLENYYAIIEKGGAPLSPVVRARFQEVLHMVFTLTENGNYNDNGGQVQEVANDIESTLGVMTHTESGALGWLLEGACTAMREECVVALAAIQSYSGHIAAILQRFAQDAAKTEDGAGLSDLLGSKSHRVLVHQFPSSWWYHPGYRSNRPADQSTSLERVLHSVTKKTLAWIGGNSCRWLNAGSLDDRMFFGMRLACRWKKVATSTFYAKDSEEMRNLDSDYPLSDLFLSDVFSMRCGTAVVTQHYSWGCGSFERHHATTLNAKRQFEMQVVKSGPLESWRAVLRHPYMKTKEKLEKKVLSPLAIRQRTLTMVRQPRFGPKPYTIYYAWSSDIQLVANQSHSDAMVALTRSILSSHAAPSLYINLGAEFPDFPLALLDNHGTRSSPQGLTMTVGDYNDGGQVLEIVYETLFDSGSGYRAQWQLLFDHGVAEEQTRALGDGNLFSHYNGGPAFDSPAHSPDTALAISGLAWLQSNVDATRVVRRNFDYDAAGGLLMYDGPGYNVLSSIDIYPDTALTEFVDHGERMVRRVDVTSARDCVAQRLMSASQYELQKKTKTCASMRFATACTVFGTLIADQVAGKKIGAGPIVGDRATRVELFATLYHILSAVMGEMRAREVSSADRDRLSDVFAPASAVQNGTETLMQLTYANALLHNPLQDAHASRKVLKRARKVVETRTWSNDLDDDTHTANGDAVSMLCAFLCSRGTVVDSIVKNGAKMISGNGVELLIGVAPRVRQARNLVSTILHHIYHYTANVLTDETASLNNRRIREIHRTIERALRDASLFQFNDSDAHGGAELHMQDAVVTCRELLRNIMADPQGDSWIFTPERVLDTTNTAGFV